MFNMFKQFKLWSKVWAVKLWLTFSHNDINHSIFTDHIEKHFELQSDEFDEASAVRRDNVVEHVEETQLDAQGHCSVRNRDWLKTESLSLIHQLI